MKALIAIAVCATLSGCGVWERTVAGYTGYSRVCVAGVSYLQFTSGATVEYTTEGKIRTCT